MKKSNNASFLWKIVFSLCENKFTWQYKISIGKTWDFLQNIEFSHRQHFYLSSTTCLSSRSVRRAEVVIFTYGWLVCLVLTMQIDKWQVVWLVVIHNTNTYFYSACTLVFNLQSFTKNIFKTSSIWFDPSILHNCQIYK